VVSVSLGGAGELLGEVVDLVLGVSQGGGDLGGVAGCCCNYSAVNKRDFED